MFTSEWLTLPTSRLLTLTLLHFVWQGFAVAFALLAVVEACRVRRAAARYACSLTALVILALSPVATLAILMFSREADSIFSLDRFNLAATPFVASSAFSSAWLGIAEPYLLAAWLIGVGLFSSRLLTGAIGVARLRGSRIPLPVELSAIVQRLSHRLRMHAAPLVGLSHQITDAMAVGLVRPLVLIPASWITEMPLEMLEAVIAHELAHLARRDLWINLLQRIVETLLFYHPAVWWLSRRLRIERELCADDLAVAATGKRLEYAQTLEHIAGERLTDIRPALAAFLRGETDMRLLQRVRNVLDQPPNERSRLWPAGLAALALPLGLWAAAAFNNRAIADDDDDKKPAIKREREERAEIKRATARPERERKEGDKRTELIEERLFELKSGADREPRKPARAEQIEERVERYVIRRDGEAPQEVERKIVMRDGKPVTVDVRKDEKPAPQGDRRLDELTVLVKRLSAQVERLQDEVSQLRGQKDGEKPATQRKQLFNKFERDGDGEQELAARKRELQQAAEKIEAAHRALDEQKEALAAQFSRRDKETLQRAIRQKNEEAAEQKRRAENAELKAREGQEKAELKAREAKEKAIAGEREKKERVLGELKRAKELKEDAIKESIDKEKKELEKKLKNLEEGQDTSANLEFFDFFFGATR